MDKLFDLMTMAVKYQFQVSRGPIDLLLITMNHLDGLRSMFEENQTLVEGIDYAHLLVKCLRLHAFIFVVADNEQLLRSAALGALADPEHAHDFLARCSGESLAHAAREASAGGRTLSVTFSNPIHRIVRCTRLGSSVTRSTCHSERQCLVQFAISRTEKFRVLSPSQQKRSSSLLQHRYFFVLHSLSTPSLGQPSMPRKGPRYETR